MAKHYDANPVITVDEAGNYVAPGGGGGGSSNPNGQATMANSAPVVIASNQSAVPVSQASQPLPTGAATESTLSSLNTKTPALGQGTSAASQPVVIASDQSTVPVSLTSVPTHAVTQSGTFTVTPAFGSAFPATISTASTNAASVKTSSGILQEVTISNPTATAAYFKVYNKASAPTVGTDNPALILPVSANSIATLSWDGGKRFSVGIAYALTGAMAISDTTASVAGIIISGTYF